MARRGSAVGRGSSAPAARSGAGIPDSLLDSAIDNTPEIDHEAVARNLCLRLLTNRARTRTELATALAARDIPGEIADHVLDRLASVGLVDDQAFAASFASGRHHDRGLAAREISRQLRDKGVAQELVDEAVLEIDPECERATAARLVERKLRSMSALAPEVQTRRLAGMLARKGYSPPVAFQVVRDVLGAAVDDQGQGDTV
jgi:regulatory protein